MREIKFRFYDKLEKEMVYSNKSCLPEFFEDYDNSIPNAELMQYTGLKDKNGAGLTEVYEGDIVSIDGALKGNIYENDKEPTDIVIPQLGTKAWDDAYKKAVERGYGYSEWYANKS